MTDEIPKMFTDTGLSPVARVKSKRTASLSSSTFDVKTFENVFSKNVKEKLFSKMMFFAESVL